MTLAAKLSHHTREGRLCERLEDDRVRCVACGHRCPIPSGFAGVCKVRFNQSGTLLVPYGYVNALQCDPIEKKPFFHVIPGATALSFGMVGCSYHCGYCQNWVSSQALRDGPADIDFQQTSAAGIVRLALASNAGAVVSTYNEPLITCEWAAAVFRVAHRASLWTGLVSNGNASPEALAYLRPYLDLFKIDLKTMDDARYRQLGGRLAPVLDSIAAIHAMGIWLEVVTLVVPGFNDSSRDLCTLARFLSAVSPDIPWHVTAFHPAYKMRDVRSTPANALLRAASIGRDAGLRYVYAGNLSGLGDLENTRCSCCDALLIERRGFHVLLNRVTAEGRCPSCGTTIPGVWRAARRTSDASEMLADRRCG